MGFDENDFRDYGLTPINPTIPLFFSALGSAIVAAIVVGAVAVLFAVLQ